MLTLLQEEPHDNVAAPDERPLPHFDWVELEQEAPYSPRECAALRMGALRGFLVREMTMAVLSETREEKNEQRTASASATEPNSPASTETKTIFRTMTGCPHHPGGAFSSTRPRVICKCSVTVKGDRSTCGVCLCDFDKLCNFDKSDTKSALARILPCGHAFHVSPLFSPFSVSACSYPIPYRPDASMNGSHSAVSSVLYAKLVHFEALFSRC